MGKSPIKQHIVLPNLELSLLQDIRLKKKIFKKPCVRPQK